MHTPSLERCIERTSLPLPSPPAHYRRCPPPSPPSFAVAERRLHEPIGDNQSRNTERSPPGERARMEKVRGEGEEGVWAATTRVCICVLICPNLMRDRLVQTPVPPLPLRFTLSSRAAWTRMGGWVAGWLAGQRA